MMAGRRVSVAMLAATLVGMVAAPAFAQPLNDNFSDAAVIGSLPFTDSQDTTDATTEAGEPDECGVGIGATVWYVYTPVEDQTIVANTFGSSHDTVLAVFEENQASPLVCNDDHFDLRSRVQFDAIAGTNYFLQAGGFEGDSGALEISVTVAPPPPSNDDFAAATLIDTLPFTDTVSTLSATTESGEADDCGFSVGGTVWYAFTPLSDETFVADTFGSEYDTVLAVFEESQEELLACNDDSGGLQSRLIFDATADTTYYIQAGGLVGDAGSLTFNLDVAPPAPANDDRASAYGVEALPFTDALNTLSATTEPVEPGCAGIGRTVWYSFTPSIPGLLAGDTYGSDYDTVLAVYVEIAGQLISLGCSDDAGGTLQSALTVPMVPGVELLFQAGGYGGSSGNLVFNLA